MLEHSLPRAKHRTNVSLQRTMYLEADCLAVLLREVKASPMPKTRTISPGHGCWALATMKAVDCG